MLRHVELFVWLALCVRSDTLRAVSSRWHMDVEKVTSPHLELAPLVVKVESDDHTVELRPWCHIPSSSKCLH